MQPSDNIKYNYKNPAVLWFSLALLLSAVLLIFPAVAVDEKITFQKDRVLIKTSKEALLFDVEIAEKPAQQQQGLMNRDSLAENSGMIFIFGKDAPKKIAMWMKDTLIPLDMLFMDKSGEILHIVHSAEPSTLTPRSAGDKPIRAVLELKGGTSKAKGIEVGDKVVFRAFEP